MLNSLHCNESVSTGLAASVNRMLAELTAVPLLIVFANTFLPVLGLQRVYRRGMWTAGDYIFMAATAVKI